MKKLVIAPSCCRLFGVETRNLQAPPDNRTDTGDIFQNGEIGRMADVETTD